MFAYRYWEAIGRPIGSPEVDWLRAEQAVDFVKLAESFGATGLKIEHPDQIAPMLKKALAMHGPVVVAIPVDYRGVNPIPTNQFCERMKPFRHLSVTALAETIHEY